jgi:hypothetical protein
MMTRRECCSESDFAHQACHVCLELGSFVNIKNESNQPLILLFDGT